MRAQVIIFFVNMDNRFPDQRAAQDQRTKSQPLFGTGSNMGWCSPLSAFSKNSSDLDGKLEEKDEENGGKRTSIWRALVSFVLGLVGSSFQ